MFSTTTVPSRGFTLSAHGRPTASNAPPGGNGTTSRIGRVGYVCARTTRDTAGSAQMLVARWRKARRGNLMTFLNASAQCCAYNPTAHGVRIDYAPAVEAQRTSA